MSCLIPRLQVWQMSNLRNDSVKPSICIFFIFFICLVFFHILRFPCFPGQSFWNLSPPFFFGFLFLFSFIFGVRVGRGLGVYLFPHFFSGTHRATLSLRLSLTVPVSSAVAVAVPALPSAHLCLRPPPPTARTPVVLQQTFTVHGPETQETDRFTNSCILRAVFFLSHGSLRPPLTPGPSSTPSSTNGTIARAVPASETAHRRNKRRYFQYEATRISAGIPPVPRYCTLYPGAFICLETPRLSQLFTLG